MQVRFGDRLLAPAPEASGDSRPMATSVLKPNFTGLAVLLTPSTRKNVPASRQCAARGGLRRIGGVGVGLFAVLVFVIAGF